MAHATISSSMVLTKTRTFTGERPLGGHNGFVTVAAAAPEKYMALKQAVWPTHVLGCGHSGNKV